MRRIEILPGANRNKRPLWAEFIFVLDSWLRRREGVFEYSRKPDCIFRARLSRLSNDVLLSDGTIGRSGDRVIDLHLWNEQIPVAPVARYSLAWGCRFNRSFAKSLGELAQSLVNKPELSDINIIRANINLDPLHRIAARHGFEIIREPVKPSPWERVHRFGQNILYWLLTLACHSGRARPNKFWRSRQLLYLSRRILDCKLIAATRGHSAGSYTTPIRVA
jgi:YkoP domain